MIYKSRGNLLPLIITSIVFVIILLYKKRDKNLEIRNNSSESIVEILRVYTKRKGITGTEHVADIEYMTNEGLKKSRVPFNSKMEVGKCYEVVYSNRNVNLIEIDYSKKLSCLDGRGLSTEQEYKK